MQTQTEPRIVVETDAAAVAARVAQSLKEAQEATEGAFWLALAGGSTPRRLYERLAQEPYASSVDWSRWRIVYGDERCVPPDHAESNHNMATQAWLNKVPLSDAHVFRVRGEDDPSAEAARYEDLLMRHLAGVNPKIPSLSVALLGMGGDGHTASLFPGLDLTPTGRVCGVARHPDSGQLRISLTQQALNAAQQAWFVVTGASKAEMLARVLAARTKPESPQLPAAAVQPTSGSVTFFVDEAAAQKL